MEKRTGMKSIENNHKWNDEEKSIASIGEMEGRAVQKEVEGGATAFGMQERWSRAEGTVFVTS